MTKHFTPRRGIVAVRAEADPPVAELAAQIKSAFSGFKARHESQLAAADQRMDEIEKIVGREGIGGGGARSDRPDATEISMFYSAVRRRDVGPAEAAGSDISQYRAALAQYIRVGEAGISPDIRAAMQVGSDPDGGYWATPELSVDIKKRLFDTSPMRALASAIIVTGADSVRFPTDTTDATSGGWVGETASRDETATPQAGEQLIYLREQYAQPKVTQKLLDMASFPVEAWLAEKIADKMSRTENTAFVSGTGVNQPRGFLDYKAAAVTTDDASRAWGVLQYVTTGASAGFPTLSGIPGAADADSLITVQHKLKAEFRANATWLMNRSTAATVRKMKDGDGRFLWADSLQQGQPPLLLGSPVTLAEDMPDIASDSFSIAFGNFRAGYQIVDGPGLRVLRDPFTAKGWVKFYTTKWTGGDVVNFDAIKLLKFGTS
jgi:HK97 family phage major capsid protein